MTFLQTKSTEASTSLLQMQQQKLYLMIPKPNPTVLGVIPYNEGVMTYCFVGFGDTGRARNARMKSGMTLEEASE